MRPPSHVVAGAGAEAPRVRPRRPQFARRSDGDAIAQSSLLAIMAAADEGATAAALPRESSAGVQHRLALLRSATLSASKAAQADTTPPPPQPARSQHAAAAAPPSRQYHSMQSGSWGAAAGSAPQARPNANAAPPAPGRRYGRMNSLD